MWHIGEWGREPQHNPGTELNNSATEHEGATTGIQETTCEGQCVDVKHNVKSRSKVYECIRQSSNHMAFELLHHCPLDFTEGGSIMRDLMDGRRYGSGRLPCLVSGAWWDDERSISVLGEQVVKVHKCWD